MNIIEIARWLRVPPTMLYDMSGATFSNNEQMDLHFLTYTLTPWIERWVQELRLKLLTTTEAEICSFRFNTKSLTRLDTTTTWNRYREGRNLGVYTLNDIMDDLNSPRLDGAIGDTRIAPSTMKVLGSTDPSTPIDPKVIDSTIQTITLLGSDVDARTATEIFNATIPGASDALVKSIVDTLVKTRKVQPTKELAA